MPSTKKVRVVIDPRQPGRSPVMLAATVRLPEGRAVEATITDLSQYGFRATIAADLGEGAVFRIDLPVGSVPEARVVWIDGDIAGCVFLVPLAADEARLIAEIWDGAIGRSPA
jgi:hypothetical protein